VDPNGRRPACLFAHSASAAGRAALSSQAIEKELGRGGFGTVYSAVHDSTHERVAIKLQKPRAVARSSRRKRGEEEAADGDGLDAEISLLKRLSNPNVVRYIGAMHVETPAASRRRGPSTQRCVILQ